MHPSVERLLACAVSATAQRAPKNQVTTLRDVAVALGVSAQTMTNWKSRGLSRDGALQAQRVFGCSPQHLLNLGVGQPETTSALVLAEELPVFGDAERKAEQSLLHLGQLLSAANPALRSTLADVLAGWARDGGANTAGRVSALLALLRP